MPRSSSGVPLHTRCDTACFIGGVWVVFCYTLDVKEIFSTAVGAYPGIRRIRGIILAVRVSVGVRGGRRARCGAIHNLAHNLVLLGVLGGLSNNTDIKLLTRLDNLRHAAIQQLLRALRRRKCIHHDPSSSDFHLAVGIQRLDRKFHSRR